MDLQQINFGRGAKPEVDPKIVLRKIASAAMDFFGLDHFSSDGFDHGSDSLPIFYWACQLHHDPVIAVVAGIAQHHGAPIEVFDHHVNAAIVEHIAEGSAP